MSDHHHQPTESTPIVSNPSDHVVHHHHHQQETNHHHNNNDSNHASSHHPPHHHRHHHHHSPINEDPPPYYGTVPNNTLMNQQFHNQNTTQYPQNGSAPNSTVVWIIKATFFSGLFFIVISMISSWNNQHFPVHAPDYSPITPTHPHWTTMPSVPIPTTYPTPTSYPTPTTYPTAIPLPDPLPYPDQDSPADRNCTYTQRETTHAITGHYILCDSLELSTITGAIDITLSIAARPVPATLKINSQSGPIRIRLADEHLLRFTQFNTSPDPDTNTDALARIFNTEISTQSSPISTTYLLGNGGTTRITSQSGVLDIQLFAINVSGTAPISELYINADAAQNVTVKSVGGGEEISRLRAEHALVGEGVLDVMYPSEWKGRVEAKYIGDGELEVRGEGLVVDQRDTGRVVAHRGVDLGDQEDEDGFGPGVVVSSVGGGLRFRC